MVRIVYLARLRDAFGTSAEQVDLPGDIGTVAALLAWLRTRGGVWADELASGRAVRVAVNHDIALPTTPIQRDDEVALFPPVTGG
jgi:molybdopterin synthase sulfur carrier subunit